MHQCFGLVLRVWYDSGEKKHVANCDELPTPHIQERKLGIQRNILQYSPAPMGDYNLQVGPWQFSTLPEHQYRWRHSGHSTARPCPAAFEDPPWAKTAWTAGHFRSPWWVHHQNDNKYCWYITIKSCKLGITYVWSLKVCFCLWTSHIQRRKKLSQTPRSFRISDVSLDETVVLPDPSLQKYYPISVAHFWS